jgi:hypothetical protein
MIWNCPDLENNEDPVTAIVTRRILEWLSNSQARDPKTAHFRYRPRVRVVLVDRRNHPSPNAPPTSY